MILRRRRLWYFHKFILKSMNRNATPDRPKQLMVFESQLKVGHLGTWGTWRLNATAKCSASGGGGECNSTFAPPNASPLFHRTSEIPAKSLESFQIAKLC